ncbi:M14 family zinc carboxypeptidase [Legionella beliardensis]|nr:M14 family zinc carboxypeptidase [Legionella beliardensis]
MASLFNQTIRTSVFIQLLLALLMQCFVINTMYSSIANINNKTLLELSNYQKLPNSAEINQFLKNLEQSSNKLKLIHLGQSAGGRPFTALLISNDESWLQSGPNQTNKLTVLLIGSQHGTEFSGCEALQKLALNFARGNLDNYLQHMNLILIVNGNPDGRDKRIRFNEKNNNINIDFINLVTPEAQIIVNVLRKYQPDVLLDLHESSVRKKILTDQQGFMTNVNAQYDAGNNLNIDPDLRQYMQDILLPDLIQRSEKNGLPSRHYQGEIQQLEQPVAHGGLRVSNLRNYAALQGVASFLVENRLDPASGKFATPANILNRLEKQYLSAVSFLQVINQHKEELKSKVRLAKETWQNNTFAQKPVYLTFNYSLNVRNPRVSIQLIEEKTGHLVGKLFPNFDFIAIEKNSALPEAYAVTIWHDRIAALLRKHHIAFKAIDKPQLVLANSIQLTSIKINYPKPVNFRITYQADIQYITSPILLKQGDLIVPTKQPNGLLVPILLDVLSMDSLYQGLLYRPLLMTNKTMPIFPVVLSTLKKTE